MSFLSIAIEQHESSAVEETEYSQFLKLTNEQLKSIISDFKSCRRIMFSESKLPTMVGKSRLRHYTATDDSESSYELTTKTACDDAHTKIEDNVSITKEMYCALNGLADLQVIRTRIFIPITKQGEPILKRDGSALEWELDLYIAAPDVDTVASLSLSNWVKLELEVDKATLENVVEYIPFNYETIILSDTNVPEERAQIANLYNVEYNVLNKLNESMLTDLSK